MHAWQFNLCLGGMMKELKVEVSGEGVILMENGKEHRIPCLLEANNLVMFG